MDTNGHKLSDQAALLNTVFPDGGISKDYLAWLYVKAPDGCDIASDYWENGELLGHYTVVPQTWCFGGEFKPLALSLNTAVHAKARGKGLFTQLAEQSYAAASTRGACAIIGVANANSTPGFLKRLGFKLVCALPVVGGFVMPTADRSVASFRVDANFLASEEYGEIAKRIGGAPASLANVQAWSREKLTWRLSSPRGRYALHTNESGTLITTTASLPMGIPTVIALKFFSHSAKVISTKPLIRSAAAFHKTPLFVYSGFNERANVSGTNLPRRLLPSPLNLIYRPLSSSAPLSDDITFATFEFLDFDAY